MKPHVGHNSTALDLFLQPKISHKTYFLFGSEYSPSVAKKPKYCHTPLFEASNGSTSSSSSEAISPVTRIARHLHMFFHVACRGVAVLTAHAYNHVSTIATVVFSYRYRDSHSDDDDNRTIATIAQP